MFTIHKDQSGVPEYFIYKCAELKWPLYFYRYHRHQHSTSKTFIQIELKIYKAAVCIFSPETRKKIKSYDGMRAKHKSHLPIHPHVSQQTFLLL